jgi:glutamine synthetase adenylyltransferase
MSASLALELDYLANDIFEEYKEIDVDVFSSSTKHPLPVPVLFKRIKFQQHADKLRRLSRELSGILREIEALQFHPDNPEYICSFLEILREYSLHLKSTIDKLLIICDQCSLNAEFKSMFRWKKYKSEVSDYKEMAEQLMDLGEKKNQRLKEICPEA